MRQPHMRLRTGRMLVHVGKSLLDNPIRGLLDLPGVPGRIPLDRQITTIPAAADCPINSSSSASDGPSTEPASSATRDAAAAAATATAARGIEWDRESSPSPVRSTPSISRSSVSA